MTGTFELGIADGCLLRQYVLEHIPPDRIELEAVSADDAQRTVVNVQVAPEQTLIEAKISLRGQEAKPPM